MSLCSNENVALLMPFEVLANLVNRTKFEIIPCLMFGELVVGIFGKSSIMVNHESPDKKMKN